MSKTQNLRTWIEIDTKAIAHNIARLKKFLKPKTKFMAVVKSDAYGHGMVAYAKEARKSGVDFFGVDSFEEAIELRDAGIKESILVLGYIFPAQFKEAAEKGISVTISNLDSLRAIEKLKTKKPLKIHVKIDTGLHRQGFLGVDAESVFSVLRILDKQMIVEGLYTHFAAMESPKYESYSRMQIDRLEKWYDAFLALGYNPIVHSSASSGIVYSREFHFDMVRAGISLYGLWPSTEIAEAAPKTKLIAALSWKAIVSEIKKVHAGERVGYDLTERLSRDSTLAVVPVGYFHGIPRSLSNKAEFLVRGKRAKIVGRVSMDMVVVDVTDIRGVKSGDEAVIIGARGLERISAEEVAEKAGTINYEIVTRIHPSIPRIYR
jgi:alanine racemase